MTGKGRPKTFEDKAAIKKAQELFWEKGYEATSLNDLIEEMGISRQSMYNTFGNKHDLFILCFESYVEESYQHLQELFLSDKTANQKYHEFTDMVTKAYCESKKGCFISATIQELAVKDKKVQDILDKKYQRNYELLFNYFSEGIEKGEICSELAAKELTDLFDSLLLSVTSLCKLSNRDDQIKSIFSVFEKQISFC